MPENKTLDSWYEEIWNKHKDAIFQYILLRYAINTVDAEDCTQKVFIELFIQGEKLMEHPNIAGWLYKTAYHFGKKLQKDYKNHDNVHLNSYENRDDNPLVIYLEPYFVNLEDEIDVDEVKDRILARLKPQEYDLYTRFYINHNSIIKIGADLDIKVNNVKQRLFRLRLQIRKLIKEEISRIFPGDP